MRLFVKFVQRLTLLLIDLPLHTSGRDAVIAKNEIYIPHIESPGFFVVGFVSSLRTESPTRNPANKEQR